MTDAKKDQDHIEIFIYNKPSIPDRTDYIIGKSDNNPVYPMIQAGKVLENQNVDYIAIPCITAHYYYKELESQLKPDIIHGIEETAFQLIKYGIDTVGLMATEGTITSNIFQNVFERYGIKIITPGLYEQKCVNHLIYNNVKANQPVEMDKFFLVSNSLIDKGSQVNILGCSELSLIKRDFDIGFGFLDTMEALAKRSILLCGGKLKEEYKCLFSEKVNTYHKVKMN
jgi:aspartate racemase